jgi:2,3-bisphosphoglycerate-dependent phosphoglycerate mutase
MSGSVDHRLVLVRHGRTEWTEERRWCGWTDLPLSPRGAADARLAATEVADLLGRDVPASFVTSDLQRCTATAAAIARWAGSPWPPPRPDRRWRELHFGDVEGRTWAELDESTQARLLDVDDFSAPGGESVAQLADRVAAAVGELGPGTHVVVTHGGVIRLLSGWSGAAVECAPGGVVVLDEPVVPPGHGRTGDENQ